MAIDQFGQKQNSRHRDTKKAELLGIVKEEDEDENMETTKVPKNNFMFKQPGSKKDAGNSK